MLKREQSPMSPLLGNDSLRSVANADRLHKVGAFLRWQCGSLREAFNFLDWQGAGNVSAEAFAEGLRNLECAEDPYQVFRALDRENNGFITFRVFLVGLDPKGVHQLDETSPQPAALNTSGDKLQHSLSSKSTTVRRSFIARLRDMEEEVLDMKQVQEEMDAKLSRQHEEISKKIDEILGVHVAEQIDTLRQALSDECSERKAENKMFNDNLETIRTMKLDVIETATLPPASPFLYGRGDSFPPSSPFMHVRSDRSQEMSDAVAPDADIRMVELRGKFEALQTRVESRLAACDEAPTRCVLPQADDTRMSDSFNNVFSRLTILEEQAQQASDVEKQRKSSDMAVEELKTKLENIRIRLELRLDACETTLEFDNIFSRVAALEDQLKQVTLSGKLSEELKTELDAIQISLESRLETCEMTQVTLSGKLSEELKTELDALRMRLESKQEACETAQVTLFGNLSEELRTELDALRMRLESKEEACESVRLESKQGACGTAQDIADLSKAVSELDAAMAKRTEENAKLSERISDPEEAQTAVAQVLSRVIDLEEQMQQVVDIDRRNEARDSEVEDVRANLQTLLEDLRKQNSEACKSDQLDNFFSRLATLEEQVQQVANFEKQRQKSELAVVELKENVEAFRRSLELRLDSCEKALGSSVDGDECISSRLDHFFPRLAKLEEQAQQGANSEKQGQNSELAVVELKEKVEELARSLELRLDGCQKATVCSSDLCEETCTNSKRATTFSFSTAFDEQTRHAVDFENRDLVKTRSKTELMDFVTQLELRLEACEKTSVPVASSAKDVGSRSDLDNIFSRLSTLEEQLRYAMDLEKRCENKESAVEVLEAELQGFRTQVVSRLESCERTSARVANRAEDVGIGSLDSDWRHESSELRVSIESMVANVRTLQANFNARFDKVEHERCRKDEELGSKSEVLAQAIDRSAQRVDALQVFAHHVEQSVAESKTRTDTELHEFRRETIELRRMMESAAAKSGAIQDTLNTRLDSIESAERNKAEDFNSKIINSQILDSLAQRLDVLQDFSHRLEQTVDENWKHVESKLIGCSENKDNLAEVQPYFGAEFERSVVKQVTAETKAEVCIAIAEEMRLYREESAKTASAGTEKLLASNASLRAELDVLSNRLQDHSLPHSLPDCQANLSQLDAMHAMQGQLQDATRRDEVRQQQLSSLQLQITRLIDTVASLGQEMDEFRACTQAELMQQTLVMASDPKVARLSEKVDTQAMKLEELRMKAEEREYDLTSKPVASVQPPSSRSAARHLDIQELKRQAKEKFDLGGKRFSTVSLPGNINNQSRSRQVSPHFSPPVSPRLQPGHFTPPLSPPSRGGTTVLRMRSAGPLGRQTNDVPAFASGRFTVQTGCKTETVSTVALTSPEPSGEVVSALRAMRDEISRMHTTDKDFHDAICAFTGSPTNSSPGDLRQLSPLASSMSSSKRSDGQSFNLDLRALASQRPSSPLRLSSGACNPLSARSTSPRQVLSGHHLAQRSTSPHLPQRSTSATGPSLVLRSATGPNCNLSRAVPSFVPRNALAKDQ